MRVVSIIGMILSILIIIGSFLAMGAAYADYKSSVSRDFGEFGGYVRHMDYQPYIVGVVFGFVLLIGSIIGMAVSKKKPQPIVNVYNQQPQQHPLTTYSPVNHQHQHQNFPQNTGAANVDVFINQAVQSYNAKDYNNAIAILLRATSIAPYNNIVHFNLACLYSLTEQKDVLS